MNSKPKPSSSSLPLKKTSKPIAKTKNPYSKQPQKKTLSETKGALAAKSAADSLSKKITYKAPVWDNKRGLRTFLALTPQEKKWRLSVSKNIRNFFERRRVANQRILLDTNESEKFNELPAPIRYKRPFEKLLKRIKIERKENIPSDINIHRRRLHRASFTGNHAVRHEIDRIHNILEKRGCKVQPNVGYDYNKKQRRLLLGFRHRQLDKKWYYFGFFKNLFPRRIRPNSHIPDAIFFIFNLMLIISTGVTFGFIHATDGFVNVLESTYDFEAFTIKSTNHTLSHQGHRYWYWDQNASFETYATWYFIITMLLFSTVLLGFVGVYQADQKIHAAYVIGMILSLLVKTFISSSMAQKDFCPKVSQNLERLLELLQGKYYEKVEATDLNGQVIVNLGGDPVEIRTYKAANILDRIQRCLHCCGVHGVDDYLSKNMSVPPSCCTPLWNLNPHCATVIPTDKLEYRAKLQMGNDTNLGCLEVLETMCVNLQRMMGDSSQILNGLQWVLFFVGFTALGIQSRQIRQLKRSPHLRISAGTISQSLQASAGTEGAKTGGGGGVRAVTEASKFTEKQERLQQTKRESLFKPEETEDESSDSTESSDDLQVHTVDFGELKNLLNFVDAEDDTLPNLPFHHKTVEGFAGRFNILANTNLQPYVSEIFSTTYQNETNAALEAISNTLERQFAQHTTDYDWRKLLVKKKPKGKAKVAAPVVTKVQRKPRAPIKNKPKPVVGQVVQIDDDDGGASSGSESGRYDSRFSGSDRSDQT